MSIIRSLGWEREPMFDASNTTYECTRIRGSLIVSYNPKAVSFRAVPNNPSAIPTAFDGRMPVQTDIGIRRFLEQPRGQLRVTSNDTDWLVSPVDFRNGPKVCDVRNGPFVKVNSIAQIPGERLWQIHLEFETFINESPDVTGTSFPPLFLSNRWYAVDDTNWQHLRTRIYQGTCTVRGDVLQYQNQIADQPNNQKYIDYFRDQFCAFSVPLGFQREKVHVTVTPDGNTAHYTVVDQEQLYNKRGNQQIPVRIEIADTSFTSLGGFARGVTTVANIQTSILDWVTGFNRGPQVTAAIGVALSNMYKNVLVRVWGNQKHSRIELINIALSMAQSRMGIVSPVLDTTLSEIIVTANSDNFAQVNYTIRWGPGMQLPQLLESAAVLWGNILLGPGVLAGPGPGRTFQESIARNGNTFGGGISHSQSVRSFNVPFPGSSGTRGTSATYGANPLFCLVTQALEGFDGTPAAPTALAT